MFLISHQFEDETNAKYERSLFFFIAGKGNIVVARLTDAEEDPWTGESHHSTVIAGTTEETSSNYVCVDADMEDHIA